MIRALDNPHDWRMPRHLLMAERDRFLAGTAGYGEPAVMQRRARRGIVLAPRPPTEIELNPPLETLKRNGPRRAERRKRSPW